MYFPFSLFFQLLILESTVGNNIPNHRYAQLRLWNSCHCYGKSLGEEGIYASQLGLCVQSRDNNTIHSVNVEFIDIGCSGTSLQAPMEKLQLNPSSPRLQ
jgi:hypothetical protein